MSFVRLKTGRWVKSGGDDPRENEIAQTTFDAFICNECTGVFMLTGWRDMIWCPYCGEKIYPSYVPFHAQGCYE